MTILFLIVIYILHTKYWPIDNILETIFTLFMIITVDIYLLSSFLTK